VLGGVGQLSSPDAVSDPSSPAAHYFDREKSKERGCRERETVRPRIGVAQKRKRKMRAVNALSGVGAL